MFMTSDEGPVEPHIITVTRNLEKILQEFTEANLGSKLTTVPTEELYNCVEVQFGNGFARAPSYTPRLMMLVESLNLKAAHLLEKNVSRWKRDIGVPFNILLNFEIEGRIRLAIRGCRPNGMMTLRTGEHVPTFPQIADITFCCDPSAPTAIIQSRCAKRFGTTVENSVVYAGLSTVLCQQVLLIHNLINETRGAESEKLVSRKSMFYELWRTMGDDDKAKINEVFVDFGIYIRTLKMLERGPASGSSRKTRRGRTGRKRSRRSRNAYRR